MTSTAHVSSQRDHPQVLCGAGALLLVVSLCLASLLLPATCSLAADLYVNGQTGNDANDGSQNAPKQHIQAALDACASGDTINVAAGVYYEHLVVDQDPPKTYNLIGAGAAQTIIDAQQQGGCLYDRGGSAQPFDRKIAGLTFRNGSTTGASVDIYDQNRNLELTIEDCVFESNSNTSPTNWEGGALSATFPRTVTLRRCCFAGNQAVSGGGARLFACTTVQITDCEFEDNTLPDDPQVETYYAYSGGALFLKLFDTVRIEGCVFRRNGADPVISEYIPAQHLGGAVFAAAREIEPEWRGALTMVGNTFDHNFSGGGGAVWCFCCSLEALDNTFENNTLTDTGYGGALGYSPGDTYGRSVGLVGNRFIGNSASLGSTGGGAWIVSSTGECTITGNLFQGNQAGATGGLALWLAGHQTATVSQNAFLANRAAGYGGVSLSGGSADTTVLFSSNLVAGNCGPPGSGVDQGGGLWTEALARVVLTSCTVTGNTCYGLGLYRGNHTVANCIIRENAPWDLRIWDAVNSNVTVTYTDFSTVRNDSGQPFVPGPGCLDLPPLFVNAAAGDYRLQASSPCIDAGSNSALGIPLVDILGNPRIWNGTVDMGCYEYGSTQHNTPPGSPPPPVKPVDAGSGTSPVTLTFENVTAGGDTTLTITPTGAPPPSGFKLGNPPRYYTLNTTATFEGKITIAIDYGGVSFGNEANLKLFHWPSSGGPWVDVTIHPANPAPHTIYGEVTSLSPFAIFEQAAPPTDLAFSTMPSPAKVGTEVSLGATFLDTDSGDTHTAQWDWDDGTTSSGTVTEPTAEAAGAVTGSHTYTTPGVYAVTVTVTDSYGLSADGVLRYVVIYDPSGGFVTGGGWITSPAGAYVADPSLTGKATFGFNSKYKPGAAVPTGQTQFQFRVANLDFSSSAYDWLVVAGARAKYKGTGTINNAGQYRFLLTAIDGEVNGGGGVDRFRIKIWDSTSGGVVYDNQMGDADDSDATTALGGGSIVIHKDGVGTAGVTAITGASAAQTAAGAQIVFTLTADANVSADVLNIAGRIVRRVCGDRACTAGTNTLVWNGTSDSGTRAPGGRYLVRVRARSADGQQSQAIMPLMINRAGR